MGRPPRSRVSVTVRRDVRKIGTQVQISRAFPWPRLVEVRIYLVIDPDVVDRTLAVAKTAGSLSRSKLPPGPCLMLNPQSAGLIRATRSPVRTDCRTMWCKCSSA